VIVNVKEGVVFDAAAGAPGHPSCLALNIFSAGLIVNGNGVLDADVVAPSSTVVIAARSVAMSPRIGSVSPAVGC
jgi:hypothetical protein